VQVQHLDYNFTMTRNVATYTDDTRIALGLRGSIQGQVIDRRTGRPVTRFQVLRDIPISDETWWSSTLEFREVNNSEGRFELDRVRAGKPTVTIRAEGYAPREQEIALMEGEALTGVLVELSPAGMLSGRVVDEYGEPILGALVYAGPLPERMERGAADGVRSRAGGVFEIEYDSELTSMLTASHHGYAMGWVDLTGAGRDIEIILAYGATVKGVVSLDGTPIAEANVGVAYPDASHRRGNRTVPRVNADGTFTTPPIVPGAAIIDASIRLDRRYGNRRQYLSLDVESGSVYPLDFLFSLGDGALTGRATVGGVPMADVEIALADARLANVDSLADIAAIGADEAMEIIEFRTDPQGRFSVEGLTPGDWILRANFGGSSYTMDVRIEAGIVTEQNFEVDGE